jgi:hypothetical protein
MFIKNKPCPECGCTENDVKKIDGFTNWDDYGVYRLDCGSEGCQHTWTFEQEE